MWDWNFPYDRVNPHILSYYFACRGWVAADLLGCDVRVYNPRGLPVRDPALENDIKVKVRGGVDGK